MGKRPSVPAEIKDEVERIVEAFNRRVLKKRGLYYLTRYKGRFPYLDRSD
jgi:hypothetical protein